MNTFKQVALIPEGRCVVIPMGIRDDVSKFEYRTLHMQRIYPMLRDITYEDILAIRNVVSTKKALYLENF